MADTTIDEQELEELREMASQMIPWRGEAERLALFVRKHHPDARIIQGEIWDAFFKQHDEKSMDTSPSPVELDVTSQEVMAEVYRRDTSAVESGQTDAANQRGLGLNVDQDPEESGGKLDWLAEK